MYYVYFINEGGRFAVYGPATLEDARQELAELADEHSDGLQAGTLTLGADVIDYRGTGGSWFRYEVASAP